MKRQSSKSSIFAALQSQSKLLWANLCGQPRDRLSLLPRMAGKTCVDNSVWAYLCGQISDRLSPAWNRRANLCVQTSHFVSPGKDRCKSVQPFCFSWERM
uniref:Uncharacterized protein n=1 Tax=Picea glauca TaxID=3330 RepID=A0A101LU97_PICGL|nr:hypothetical protein ABT39_MTgene2576 [Picea glauca]